MDHDNSQDKIVLSEKKSVQAGGLSRGRKIIIASGVACLVVVGFMVVWLVVRGNNKPLTSGDYQDSDTELSPAISRELDLQRAESLLSSPPAANMPADEKIIYYKDLLLSLHDNEMIISTYETVKEQDVLVSPGIAAKVAQAYIDRNLPGDKEKARAALDVGRSYIKSQPYASGDGGTDELLSDVDITQKEMGL